MKVIIKRSAVDGYEEVAEVDVDVIKNPHWGYISGGVKKVQSGYSIYGYIPYALAAAFNLASGDHNFGYNTAKIVIPASRNSEPPYQEGYRILCDKSGPKPHFRPKGQKPCTKRIMELLEAGEIQRRELRQILLSEEQPRNRIARAIRRLADTGRIECHGASNNPKQILRKKPTDDKDTPIDIDDEAIASLREVSKI